MHEDICMHARLCASASASLLCCMYCTIYSVSEVRSCNGHASLLPCAAAGGWLAGWLAGWLLASRKNPWRFSTSSTRSLTEPHRSPWPTAALEVASERRLVGWWLISLAACLPVRPPSPQHSLRHASTLLQ
ncbi:hypothetical protein GGR56DRAFT_639975 [Xylariaceae sp. FL0804]|nr:hypothetical protein GGR56DRAFT_639975 [Xylariaceae sp. FL0804]